MARTEGKRPPQPEKKPLRQPPDLPNVQAGSAPRFDRSEILKKAAAIGGALLAVVLVVSIAVGVASEDTEPPTGVFAVPYVGAAHQEGPIQYDGVPAGGSMSGTPLNCGAYENPVGSENVVHSLEHGAVWITYPPELDQASIDQLNGLARGGTKVIVSPFPGETEILVTGWGNRIVATGADDINISRFIRDFVSSGDAPEAGGRCVGTGNPL